MVSQSAVHTYIWNSASQTTVNVTSNAGRGIEKICDFAYKTVGSVACETSWVNQIARSTTIRWIQVVAWVALNACIWVLTGGATYYGVFADNAGICREIDIVTLETLYADGLIEADRTWGHSHGTRSAVVCSVWVETFFA